MTRPVGLYRRLLVLIFSCLPFFTLPVVAAAESPQEWFGGEPPLGAQDQRRHLFRPYSAVELNYLGANYCENLLDKRINTTSYTHLGFDSNRSDAWHLQFPDDAARIAEAFVWEDRYSGIARLETVRRFVKGMLAAHVPGTRGYHFFRHRSGGKTYLIFDQAGGEGRVLLSNWGDEIQGLASVGFQARMRDGVLEQRDFSYEDRPKHAGTPAVARSSQYWNASPFVFQREFKRADLSVQFQGRYWLSDEDMPIEYAYESSQADEIAVTIGQPGKHIPLLWDAQTEGIIDFGDRATQWRSERDGDQVLKMPDCHYLVLRKNTTWACPGYGSCLLVMWDGQPDAVEAVAEQGYGQLRIVFPRRAGLARGCVWLFPFHWINEDDMRYVFRNAECFLAQGRLMHNGFPSQQLVNSIPAGLAAGAVMLTKYHDPMARTAQIEAANAVDALLDPELKGRRFVRLFQEVKAAAWMVELGKLRNDASMVDKYTAWVKLTMDRLLSPDGGYDGNAWGDGWSHFNNMKATWLAYEATGNEAYQEAYRRAMNVYTIDQDGIYRNGQPLQAPGGFEVYAGTLPMAVWGHWGLRGQVEQLINLQVPNGWHQPGLPVSELWNDAGAGPWSQDDAQPDMVGFMLRGFDIPREPKRLLPTGAFPKFNEAGEFEATWAPVVDNPFFLPGERDIHELTQVERLPAIQTKTIELDVSGQNGTPPSITQCVKVQGAAGAALDVHMTQGSYLVEVSADGKHWLPRLDTWCDAPTTRSIDLSYLLGSRDELVRVLQVAPPDDAAYIQSSTGSDIARTHCRTIAPGGQVVYRFALAKIDQCHLEVLVGNDYRIDLSRDGNEWNAALSPTQIVPAKGDEQRDATWLRMVDATQYVGSAGELFVRFRNGGDTSNSQALYGDATAVLRRISIYANHQSSEIHVRLRGAPHATESPLAIEWMRLRTW